MRNTNRRMAEGARLISGKLERLARALAEPRKIMRRKYRFRRLQSIFWLNWKLDLDQKRAHLVALVERPADLATWAGDPIAVGLNPHAHRVVRRCDRVIGDLLCQAGHNLDSRQHLRRDPFTAWQSDVDAGCCAHRRGHFDLHIAIKETHMMIDIQR